MLKRILSGAVGIPLVLGIILFAPVWALAALLSFICVFAQIEFLRNTGITRSRFVLVCACVFAGLVPFWCWAGLGFEALLAGIVALTMTLFGAAMFGGKIRFAEFAPVYFSALVIPLMFSSLVGIQSSETGAYLVFFPFAAAWMSDIGGLFCGRWFGRKKLCPAISPNKTVEGAVGGLVFAAVGAALYAVVLRFAFGVSPNWAVMVPLGLVCSVTGQLGDVMFSFVKRERGIKDYGRLIPGHGGVLDRFDSVVTTAPVVWFAMSVFTLVTL
ncbi:MAG: phosphatidate cytidylyltransferase [Oscillospiraceae bacterium]|nr:phosphatidate cytidylyltransferase [Oscillospiraceae bacterium]